ncbi:hypothetical protein VOLCADRAFT_97142 [Volvox carteri f. nagariensis]|uniref:Uncharacterized protein n=1 Tax=Volvox carteri f. nagariensis TaxID=3068 RepID=D8UBZ8_VOLCA|nr:uncharacterized protein VOLCADRAFT_97142 [Volvox carteri f. nagariensis]EFJ42758.1 hypothetical protein VOLCADRAFT_97142 [Volvox carteri f. nagariensis]|eukprot:XP_002956219.1 hypothetical protein VOLCADRAFT_97142 [Volvox carteri f. nagariensis]
MPVLRGLAGFVPGVGRDVEANVTPGEFFEGWHKGGRRGRSLPRLRVSTSSHLPGGHGAGVWGSRNGSPERSRFGGGFGAASAAGGGLALMPTQPDLLSDAQRWVANWPDAVGQTNLLSAFHVAEQHAAADCWYILSDGLAHDQQACLEYLARRSEAGCLPVIHAVVLGRATRRRGAGMRPNEGQAGRQGLGVVPLMGAPHSGIVGPKGVYWHDTRGHRRAWRAAQRQDWEDAKATLERQRSEQLAATRGSPYSTPGKPPLPFVSMISGGGGIGSRPTSATAYAALPKNKEGSGLIRIAYEPSEQRAACAAAEYDAAMGLERLAEKLSSPLHTPPGSRPVSALSSGALYGSGSRPVSGLKAAASGGGSGAAAGAGGGDGSMETGGGASEYLEAITEDLAEASAPLDALYGTAGAGAAAAGSRISSTDVLDDDGLDVRPSRGRSGGRDQDSAVGSSASAPPPLPLSLASSSAASAAPSPRPVSARGASAGNSARVTSARSSAGRKATGLGMLPEGAPLPPEGPPPLPEPSAPLQPLRGEKSDEFKQHVALQFALLLISPGSVALLSVLPHDH